jgi:hypothetical protein
MVENSCPIFKKQKKVNKISVVLDSIAFKYHRHAGAQKREAAVLKERNIQGLTTKLHC